MTYFFFIIIIYISYLFIFNFYYRKYW